MTGSDARWRSKGMQTMNLKGIMVISAVISAATLGAGAMRYSSLDNATRTTLRSSIMCRGALYLQKVQGGLPELSWVELFRMTAPGTGIHCIDGDSPEAVLQF